MPNARVLSEKQAIVEELTRRLSSASAGVFVDYRGITVAEDTQLRRELAQNAVQYSVVKNTLTKFAIDKVGLLLLVIWVSALQIMMDEGKDKDWFASNYIITLAIIAAIGFAAAINDRDPVGKRHGLRLFGGITNSKDPKEYGTLLIR